MLVIFEFVLVVVGIIIRGKWCFESVFFLKSLLRGLVWLYVVVSIFVLLIVLFLLRVIILFICFLWSIVNLFFMIFILGFGGMLLIISKGEEGNSVSSWLRRLDEEMFLLVMMVYFFMDNFVILFVRVLIVLRFVMSFLVVLNLEIFM